MEVQFPQAPLGYCNVGVGLLLRIGFAMTLLSGGAIMYLFQHDVYSFALCGASHIGLFESVTSISARRYIVDVSHC